MQEQQPWLWLPNFRIGEDTRAGEKSPLIETPNSFRQRIGNSQRYYERSIISRTLGKEKLTMKYRLENLGV